MDDLPTPAYVTDNPVMTSAFHSFADWAWRQPEFHAAFVEETQHAAQPIDRTPLATLYHEAQGVMAVYLKAWLAWLIKDHWGEEGDPRLEEDDDDEA